MSEDDRPCAAVLGAPLPPPYGGIAHYLQVALPALARSGWDVRAIQPPGCSPKPAIDAANGGGDLRVTTATPAGPARSAAYLVRHPLLAVRLAWWYLPALARGRGYALAQLAGVLAWLLAAEAAVGERQPVVVHAYDCPWVQGVAAVLLARRWGARAAISTFGEVVPHRHELHPVDEISDPFRRVSRSALWAADAVASMSEHCRRQTVNANFDPRRVRLVRLVVGMDRFRPDAGGGRLRAERGFGDAPMLLFVGQVRARKGPQTLIDAMPEVLRAHPRAQLLIVGPDHGYSDSLESRARELGVDAAVELVGAVAEDDLPAYFAAADAFVFPTLTPIECLGLTFIQAMYSGTPVVATRIAGAPEVITDGDNGFLVPPDDPVAFAAAVSELLALPPERRSEIGQRGRRRAHELFDESAVLDDLLRLYRDLARA